MLSGLEKLRALEAIQLLKARRDRAADTKDWELYESLHAPDHVSRNGSFPAWRSAAEMIANVSRIMTGLSTAHHSHTPEIEFESPVHARGIWAMKGVTIWMQGADPHCFRAFGHYYETYEKRGGTWLFTSRELRYTHTTVSAGGIFPPATD